MMDLAHLSNGVVFKMSNVIYVLKNIVRTMVGNFMNELTPN